MEVAVINSFFGDRNVTCSVLSLDIILDMVHLCIFHLCELEVPRAFDLVLWFTELVSRLITQLINQRHKSIFSYTTHDYKLSI